MAMNLHQSLKLLLPLLLVFIISLPSSWSLCDLSAARRDEQTGACSKLNPNARQPRMIARRAARRAYVKLRNVEEAYSRVRYTSALLRDRSIYRITRLARPSVRPSVPYVVM